VTDFWPSGLDLSDTSSPLEILQSAQQEWTEHSGGLLGLVIQEAESASGNHLLILHAKHVPSNRTVTLFSVVHRVDAPYPAKIQPRDNELPDILKKSYYQPGFTELTTAGFALSQGRKVTNKWVCDTPSEFRSQLKDVFNLGSVKSEVLSLVSGAASPSHTGDGIEIIGNASDDEPDNGGS
jgi:hypothetical protein